MYLSPYVNNQPIIATPPNEYHSQANTYNIIKVNDHCTNQTKHYHFNTMKLLSTTALLLTSLLTTTTLANLSLKFEALPSEVRAGASYDVKWTASEDIVSLKKNPHKQHPIPNRKKRTNPKREKKKQKN
jgi:hypothetical protein